MDSMRDIAWAPFDMRAQLADDGDETDTTEDSESD